MGNMIDLDYTLFIQLINFLITLVVLNWLLIRPVRNQIAARKTLLFSYASDIEKFTSGASERLAHYETVLERARADAALLRESHKAEGLAREQELLRTAQANAQSYLQSSRAETAREAKIAMDSLLSQVSRFAKQGMSNILG